MDKMRLSYDQDLNAYVVQVHTDNDTDRSYVLGIKAGWESMDRVCEFVRIVYEDGDWYQILTREEMHQKVEDVREHESNACAKLWEQEQTHYQLGSPWVLAAFDKAQRRFLAFVELGLELPVVWQHQFKNPRPIMSEEAFAKLEALRLAAFNSPDGE